MNRQYVVAATFLGITACVTSAPESPDPAATAGNLVTNSNSTATVDELHVVDVPEVPEAPILAKNENPNDRICRWEQETGSHMRIRVCRTRGEIEATRLETKKALREMNTRGNKAFRPPTEPSGRQ
jgi:hypothetical protein